jgi:hypothetical protein
VAKDRHPAKEIEQAIDYATSQGWRLRKMGHWGRLFCPHADREGCQIGVNCTPKDADVHARQIVRAVDRCPHVSQDDEN